MTLVQGAILGLIQGLTEFLPISSSGHLVAAQKLMGLPTPPVSFDILIHVATLIAIIWWLHQGFPRLTRKTLWLVFIGSLPAGAVGWLIRPYADSLFDSTNLLGWGWLITGIWLLAARRRFRGTNSLNWLSALVIGTAQALAILPSISRSGSTIATALLLGISPKEALTFSLLLAIPAIAGAQVLDLNNLVNHGYGLTVSATGFSVALVSGIMSLKLIQRTLDTAKFHQFGWYCLILGIGIIIWPLIQSF